VPFILGFGLRCRPRTILSFNGGSEFRLWNSPLCSELTRDFARKHRRMAVFFYGGGESRGFASTKIEI
jgi:hypothetical protein